MSDHAPIKPAGFLLLAPASLSLLMGDEPPPRTSKLSQQLKHAISARFPAFETATPQAAPTEIQPSTDPELFQLPKLVVQEKRTPRVESDDLLNQRAMNQKLAAEYKDSLQGLDRIMNGFSIPVISPSLASRGRDLRLRQKYENLPRVVQMKGSLDSASHELDGQETKNMATGRLPGSNKRVLHGEH